MVTFFAAAKKVTAAAHSGELIDLHESKFPRSARASDGVTHPEAAPTAPNLVLLSLVTFFAAS